MIAESKRMQIQSLTVSEIKILIFVTSTFDYTKKCNIHHCAAKIANPCAKLCLIFLSHPSALAR